MKLGNFQNRLSSLFSSTEFNVTEAYALSDEINESERLGYRLTTEEEVLRGEDIKGRLKLEHDYNLRKMSSEPAIFKE